MEGKWKELEGGLLSVSQKNKDNVMHYFKRTVFGNKMREFKLCT